MVYYKIKQTNFDRNATYSNTITLQRNEKGEQIIAFPNPNATGIFNLSGHKTTTAIAQFANALGQRFTVSVFNNTLDLSNMPTGVYFLQIENSLIRLVKS